MITQDTQSHPEDTDEQAEKTWPELSFDDISEKLKDACARAGWEKLMPVQARSMAAVMHRQDVMVQARTGSGKTGAFILPIIERIDPRQNYCQALVLLPTRELARQVAEEAKMLSGGTIRTVAVYGGVGYGPQMDAFNKGAHLVVGTPGRILDHLMRGSLKIDQLDTLVFDEADRMLSIGFYPDMKQLQTYLPQRDINGLMFSATFPPMVLRLSEEFLHEPQFISLSEDHVHVAEVTHAYYQVPGMGKERALAKLIETENPSSAIIFTNTKANCNFVAAVLSQFGYNAAPLSSDLSQSKREKVLGDVRSGKLKFLVATDVAARGIDIPELSHVFLYEPPEDRESYIHRAGRTGRAGAAGEVISLVDLMQKMELQRIGTHYKIPLIERTLPETATVRSIVTQRTTALLEARYRKVSGKDREGYTLFLPTVDKLAEQDETTGQLAMLLDEFYHTSVHGKGVADSILPEYTTEAPEIDTARLLQKLARKYESMKPLSRERMMKFLLLAKELAHEDDGKGVLAMLLSDYYFSQVFQPSRPGQMQGKKKEQTNPAPTKEKKTKHPSPPAPRQAESEQHTSEQQFKTEPPNTIQEKQHEKHPPKARPTEQEPMDILARLRGMRPMEQSRLDMLLPLAEELLASKDATPAIATLLDRFERESRRVDARKAKRKGHGHREETSRQDRKPPHKPNPQAKQKPEPAPKEKPEETYHGPAHGLQPNLWDDEPDEAPRPPARKKRPRRRRRKKTS